ncbi:MAG: hypothetical protein ACTS44_01620 [Candidatus Hodgkinia cicadicola]
MLIRSVMLHFEIDYLRSGKPVNLRSEYFSTYLLRNVNKVENFRLN